MMSTKCCICAKELEGMCAASPEGERGHVFCFIRALHPDLSEAGIAEMLKGAVGEPDGADAEPVGGVNNQGDR